MANRRMNLTGTGKEILDNLCETLEIERPFGVKIAFSKGLSASNGVINNEIKDDKAKWTIPDNIIRDKEFILFKHLIINEVGKSLNDEEIHQYLLAYIEYGLRIIKDEIESLSTLEDYRIKILG
ncbi:DndE family protein [Fredinandcohnia onubensis]|uniref:DndE family protein n=1 Tax=Fredinandcohnia onubensis TaxID=1571209 RepID=UPI000C0BCD53|nr:DndE family protein [Fredinandcohnia onubensis]